MRGVWRKAMRFSSSAEETFNKQKWKQDCEKGEMWKRLERYFKASFCIDKINRKALGPLGQEEDSHLKLLLLVARTQTSVGNVNLWMFLIVSHYWSWAHLMVYLRSADSEGRPGAGGGGRRLPHDGARLHGHGRARDLPWLGRRGIQVSLIVFSVFKW